MFAELDFDTLDDPATVLASLMKMKGRVLSLDDDLTHDQLMEVVAWISDKANWSNHSVEGVCIRKGKTDKCIPAPKKKAAKKRKAKAKAPAGDAAPITPDKKLKAEPKAEPKAHSQERKRILITDVKA